MTITTTESTMSDGTLDGSPVTCPSHRSQFNVYAGAAMRELAEDPLVTCRVTVEGETRRVDAPLSHAVQGG